MKKTVKIKPKKMTVCAPKKNIYDSDFYSWVTIQANLLENKEFSKLDIKNLIEELNDLGISQENKLESHISNVVMHLLKIEYQPMKHTNSWDLSIKNSRHHANRTLKKNPGLKNKLKDILNEAYFTARLSAAQETGLREETFPEKCPWNIKEILSEAN